MWVDLWVRKIPWSRKWQPAPVFLPGKSQGQRSLVGSQESDTAEWLITQHRQTNVCSSNSCWQCLDVATMFTGGLKWVDAESPEFCFFIAHYLLTCYLFLLFIVYHLLSPDWMQTLQGQGNLFCSLMQAKRLEQCLAYTKCLIKVCWMNEWMRGPKKPARSFVSFLTISRVVTMVTSQNGQKELYVYLVNLFKCEQIPRYPAQPRHSPWLLGLCSGSRHIVWEWETQESETRFDARTPC